eukprot:scaffold935_cov196-Alexandrium_tamarense.AAC.2
MDIKETIAVIQALVLSTSTATSVRSKCSDTHTVFSGNSNTALLHPILLPLHHEITVQWSAAVVYPHLIITPERPVEFFTDTSFRYTPSYHHSQTTPTPCQQQPTEHPRPPSHHPAPP